MSHVGDISNSRQVVVDVVVLSIPFNDEMHKKLFFRHIHIFILI